MKTAILVLLGLTAYAAAVQPEQQKYSVGDKVFLERQKDILKLFKFINQPSYYKEYEAIEHNYPVLNEHLYIKPEVVKEFFVLYSEGFLPRGEIFSISYKQQREQAIALYKLFYYAKDFNVFHKTAIWARQYINEGMFVYSVSVALVHRSDTKDFVIPPIYEIFPHYFFTSEVIQQAQIYKQQLPASYQPSEHGYVINANYSGYYIYQNKEQSIMSYFTEDIGLNAFYYYYTILQPFWMDSHMSSAPYLKERVQYYVTIYQQILAKYYLERLSNGLGPIPVLDFENPMEVGFYPSLTYPNGLDFPMRPNYVQFLKPAQVQMYPGNFNYSQSTQLLMDYCRRIRDAIDLGYVINRNGEKIMIEGKNGFEILTNMIQGNPSSPNLRFYGSLPVYARYVLGYSYVPLDGYKLLPSALEQPETAMRDPMFYQLYQHIQLYFQRYLNYQSPYTYKDLELKGVKVTGFEIDRLVTYFDYFYTDITNALYVNEAEFTDNNLYVKARQERLNHKPFMYKIDVQSTQPENVVVKVFLGPKFDELKNPIFNLNDYKQYFVLLDAFEYKLIAGQNMIQRDSKQFSQYLPDKTSYKDLYYRVMTALKQGGQFYFDKGDVKLGFPSRMMLPKGTPSGQMYQMYVYVGPTNSEAEQFLMYPFNKNVMENAFDVPNAYLKDVVIYLKQFKELNVV